MDLSPSDPVIGGRKVFFIRPHSVIQEQLIAALVRAEFDVGLVKDQTKAMGLFRKHPDCIGFLNIDEGWSEADWEDFVVKVRRDPEVSRVRLGVVTYNESPVLAKRYLLDLEIPAGFVKLSLGMAASTAIILKVLEANEARGRRRYLRVNCSEEYAEATAIMDKHRITGQIRDLSIAGLSCTFDHSPQLEPKTLVQELQLRLKGIAFTVGALFIGTRVDEKGSQVHIFLFNPKEIEPHRDNIWLFLQGVLQNHLDQDLKTL